jgi:hypothetical protein
MIASVLYEKERMIIAMDTLYRKLKQIFTEMKLRGLVPNFYIYVSPSDLYMPTIGTPILRLWENKNHSQIHECGNWGTRPRSFISGNT